MEDLFGKLRRYVRDQDARASREPAPATAPDVLAPAAFGAPAAFEAPAAFDWKQEYAREYGVSMPDTSPSDDYEDPEPVDLDPTRAWQAELMREHLQVQVRTRRPYHGPIRAGSQSPLDERSLPPHPPGFDLAMVPRDFASYRTLVHETFDAPKQRLARRLVEEPAVRAVFDAWSPTDVRGNLNVTYETFDRISKLMGEIYRFRPADMGYRENMDGSWGCYWEETRKVYLSQKLLVAPAREMLATVIHEQVHKLQGELIWRLGRSSAGLTHPQRALALYWLREDRVIKQLYNAAFAQIKAGRGDGAYRRIGKEYHAFDTEETIVPFLEREIRFQR